MKYFEAFAGIGGFRFGINKAYETYYNKQAAQVQQDGQRGNGNTNERPVLLHGGPDAPLCVGYSEIDKYAIQIYKNHFPNENNFGDITKINPEDLPDFDLFVGGFPCQSFSIAGKRGGFGDKRGTMFFEIDRILRVKKPNYILLENVKGLLSHEGGRTYATIKNTLDELGYITERQTLNSKNHGVPQNRERIFIIGHLRGTPRPKVFPFTGESQENTGGNKL